MNIIVTVIYRGVQIAFGGTLLIFVVSWCYSGLTRIYAHCGKHFQSTSQHKDEDAVKWKEAEYKLKQEEWKKNIQTHYEEKAVQYRENVLIPRERTKRDEIEKKFQKHFGPLWSGEGNILGGEDDSEDEREPDLPERMRAARRRKIPEPELAAAKLVEQEIKPKRVIELPPEPSESDPEAILVTLRTPISTIVHRRFHHDQKFQSVLDFMTTSGFSDTYNQLCQSYPRQVLECPESSLSELGFGKRITLNIEEKPCD